MCLLIITYDYDTQYISVIIWDQPAAILLSRSALLPRPVAPPHRSA